MKELRPLDRDVDSNRPDHFSTGQIVRPTKPASESAALQTLSLEELWSGARRKVDPLRHISSEFPMPLTVPGEFHLLPVEADRERFADQPSDYETVKGLHVDRLEFVIVAKRDENVTSERTQVELCVWIDRRTTEVAGGASQDSVAIHESDMKVILDRCRKGSNTGEITDDDRGPDVTARFVRMNLERKNAATGIDKGSLLSFTA